MSNSTKWFVIVNPTAGNGKGGKKWPTFRQWLDEAEISYDYEITRRRGHGALLARNAIRNGYRKIMAVGGDGTNNEVMNGIMKQKVVPSNEIIYSIIPVGTGNDWIRTHNIPNKPKKVIQFIQQEKTAYQDIGLVMYDDHNGQHGRRYFMNVAGMAYDAVVAKASEEKQIQVSNKFLYLMLIFKCLMGYEAAKAKVIFDGKVDEDRYYLVNVGICKYSGGGMQLVPHAIPDNGKFALTIARHLSKMQVVLATPKFYNGKAGDHPKVELYEAKSIKVEALTDEPILLEVDGEFLGGTPVEFILLEKALQIIVP